MWFLRLPDCKSCDVRKASSWADHLCHPCRGEAQMLEEWLEQELPEPPACH